MKNNFIKIAMGVLLAAMLGMFTGCSNPDSSNGLPSGYRKYNGLEPELLVNGHCVYVEADFDDYDVSYDESSTSERLPIIVSFTKRVKGTCYAFDPFEGENLDSGDYELKHVDGGYQFIFGMPDHDVCVHLEESHVEK